MLEEAPQPKKYKKRPVVVAVAVAVAVAAAVDVAVGVAADAQMQTNPPLRRIIWNSGPPEAPVKKEKRQILITQKHIVMSQIIQNDSE